jgi:hypothetical protein
LEQLKQLASEAASGATDGLNKEEHLQKEIEILEDLRIGEIINQGGWVDMVNYDEVDDSESEFVGWGNERAETYTLASDSGEGDPSGDDDAVVAISLLTPLPHQPQPSPQRPPRLHTKRGYGNDGGSGEI